jgi:hypothetical protein
MIGVLAPTSDRRVVAEFFELFKTPWEYLRPGREYEVVLCVGAIQFDQPSTRLILHFADSALPIDVQEELEVSLHKKSETLSHNGRLLVVYGQHLEFHKAKRRDLWAQESGAHWSYRCTRNGVTIHRLGYDLFAEIAALLANGQPVEFAAFPTLEMHIAVLRDMIVESGVELIEIPPVPQGYGCVACLTHDIDHPAIKSHKWDATAFGFLYRATVGTMANALRGRIPIGDVVKNWVATIKLPLVYAGVIKDFWSGFEDRYIELERGLRTTYFVIPFKGLSGKDTNGPAPRRRASGYAASEIKDALYKIRAEGGQIGLHGIDAWHDCESGCRELNEIKQLTGESEIGVRMHWLFYGEKSPGLLEKVGASFDSSIGYRETVGFRNGTTQVYKPIGAEQILELPMHVMDTALFYSAYLGLTQREAELRVRALIAALMECGGCLTVNWHDRSLAPERNWNSCYRALLDDLKSRNAWFATAGQATSWFRLRRSVVFEVDAASSGGIRVTVTDVPREQLPPLTLRVYKSEQGAEAGSAAVKRCVDAPIVATTEQCETGILVN